MRRGSKLGRPLRQHGLTGTPEFRVFRAMEARARVTPGYEHVAVHPAWVADPRLFVAHVGLRPSPKHEIDRIDNAKGYEAGNVRWATSREQKINRKCTVWIEARGRRQCCADWARELGVDPRVIAYRLKAGWSAEDAVSTRPGDGVPYASIKDLATATGIKYHTLYARLRRGMSTSAAIAAG